MWIFLKFHTMEVVENTSIIEDLSPKKCYISAAGNKKHPSGRLVYWLAKYGDVYSTHTCSSYIHCRSSLMPPREGSVSLLPLKKKTDITGNQ